MMMQTFPMVIEMRTYKIKPGLRAEFLKIFKSKSLPEHGKIGMKILGPFLSVEDDDTLFWMRAFPDLKRRPRMRDELYEGKLWKEELEHKLMPMLEKYDVVVIEAKGGLGSWQ
jgi:dethiobiotin synthetase